MKRSRLTKLIVSTLLVASVISLNPIGASAEWKQDKGGWYYTEDGFSTTGWRKIDGKWYYFYLNGTMASNTVIDSYVIGSDGVWTGETSTGSSSSSTETYNSGSTSTGSYQSTGISSSQQSIGLDEMKLSSETEGFVAKDYNLTCRQSLDGINKLSIAGKDYLNIYPKGNILGQLLPYEFCKWRKDYYFDLNNGYSRFTATIGMDDYVLSQNTLEVQRQEIEKRTCVVTFIGDGNVLETKSFKYGDEAINVDVNISGCNKLLIRAQLNSDDEAAFTSYFDILNGQFYFN